MATAPPVPKQSAPSGDQGLPGWTVDVLLGQGHLVEAQAELLRLIDESDCGDPGVEATPQFYQEILTEVRLKAEARR